MSQPSANNLIDLINAFDNVPLDFEINYSPYYRLFLSPTDPRPHGYIHPDTVSNWPWPPSFIISHSSHSVTISSPPPSSTTTTPETHINTALQQAIDAAIQSDTFPTLNRMHSEPFRILGARPPLIHLERFASTLFGIATRGAHMTAYQKDPSNNDSLSIWIARRSSSLYTYPGKLDSTVAGGVKATDSPRDCIIAEGMEEASLPSSLLCSPTTCKAVGVLTLANRSPRTGLFHSEMLYVYDLEMPSGVVPVPADEEVESFELMGVDEVRRRMLNGEFKPNVCAVMIDFFIRHGIVTPEGEGEGDYAELCMRLRRRLPVPLVSDEYQQQSQSPSTTTDTQDI